MVASPPGAKTARQLEVLPAPEGIAEAEGQAELPSIAATPSSVSS